MTFYPASYATLHPEPTPTTAPVARPTTTQSTVSSPARTSRAQRLPDPSLDVRIADLVQEACEPVRQAFEQLQNDLRRLETTVRSHEQSLAAFSRARTGVERSHAAASMQQYAPRRQALDRGAATMPPLVDDLGTLYFADGVVVRATPASGSPTSAVERVDVDDDAEYASMPALVDGAGAPTSGTVEHEPSLTAWLGSCALPNDDIAVAAPMDPMRFSAANSFGRPTQSKPDLAADEPPHGPPLAIALSAVGRRALFGRARAADLLRVATTSSDDAVAAAAALKVRRLEVKLLRLQLLLTKKQLEQLTEDAEDLDEFESFDEEEDEAADVEEEQRGIQ